MRHSTAVRVGGLALVGISVLGACSSSSKGASSIPLSTAVVPTTVAPTTLGTSAATTATTTASASGTASSVPTTAGSTPATTPPTGPATNPTAPTTTGATADTVGPTSTTPVDPASIAFTEIADMDSPLDLTFRNGDDALYLVSKLGFVVAMRNGVIDPTKLLDISADVSTGSEQGLLGLTFSADGSHAYIDDTNVKGNTEITEYAVGADGVFDPASKRLILEIDQPYPNHNGGQVRIGPDGFLYIGMGDGGSADDPARNGQRTDVLLGKMLRIDPTPSGDSQYTIPADNPYVGVDKARPEIFSIGLRNPFRYSFDRATNDLWIADVGQDKWEEVDFAPAATGGGKGDNFGWSAYEATHSFNHDQRADPRVDPIHEYAHGDLGCSISGGVRYRGTAIPALYGWYVYGDYCSGQVRAFPVLPDGTAGAEVTLATGLTGISEVAQGPDGELYVLRVDDGKVIAVRPAG
ncbi:MAG: sugar dehydrogenase [Ilumatobacteraceae bacterium]|nr:sugar dehydrogenase [Ilumatobacteraceae bacterium]